MSAMWQIYFPAAGVRPFIMEGILANQERGTGELDADVAKVAEALDGPERGHSTAFSS